ncbi:hypothetical protein [Halocatena halophila]|uniref:hypothetical protein n=1 Tax=Halocatena halophila TaxID=2814576 RepID=UPI002ED0AE6B
MAESGWLTHAWQMGWFDFKRTLTGVWDDKSRLAMTVGPMVFVGIVGLALLVAFADELQGLSGVTLPDGARGQVAMFWVFGVYILTNRLVTQRSRLEAEAFVLTTVSARTAAMGHIIAETLRGLAYFAAPTIVLTAAGFIIFGSPGVFLTIPIATVTFVMTAILTGTAVGYLIAWLLTHVKFIRRYKTIIGGSLVAVVMGGYLMAVMGPMEGLNMSFLDWLPPGWLLDVGVLGIGEAIEGSTVKAAGSMLSSALLLIGGMVATDRITNGYWYSAPVSIDDDDDPTDHSERSYQLGPLPFPKFISQPTRRVSEWVIMRSIRDPSRLSYLTVPAIVVFDAVFIAYNDGALDVTLAPVFAIGLPWIFSEVAGMNPLGDEGSMLPLLVASISARQYIHGLLVPGLLVGLPLAGILTGLAGMISPYSSVEIAGLVGIALYLTFVAVIIAPALGMAMPRFDAISIGRSDDVLPPRMSTVVLHSLSVVVPGAVLGGLLLDPELTRTALSFIFGGIPALVLGVLDVGGVGWFEQLMADIQATDIETLRYGLGGGIIAGGLFVAGVCYQHAISRFEKYEPQ